MDYSPDEQPDADGRITPEHVSYLVESSGISPELIRSEGARTVLTVEEFVATYGFNEKQWAGPGLMLPRHKVGSPAPHDYTYRPDDPWGSLRYLTAKGSPNCLDVPKAAQSDIDDPNVALMITEGWKKALAYLSRGGRCAISLSGVWAWRGTNSKGGKVALPDWDSVALNGREVYLGFDSDAWRKPSVKQALVRLTRFLESKGARVFWIELEDAPDGSKVGLDDFLLTHTLDDLEERAIPAPSDLKPVVLPYDPDVSEQTSLAVQALVETGQVFTKGGRIIEIEEAWDGTNELVVLGDHGMKILLSEVVDCQKWVTLTGPRNTQTTQLSAIAPPLDFAKDVLSQASQFPRLQKVMKTPFFSQSGQLVREPGYDVETGIFLDLEGRCNVPTDPTAEDLRAAVAIWDEGMQGFPFDSPGSRANAFALALEPFVRAMIGGPTPVYFVEAPDPGSGKGKLASLMLRPTQRGALPQRPEPTNKEEWDKIITTALLNASSVFFIDNVKLALTSGALASATTSDAYVGRILGSNKDVRERITWTWVFTGNNPVVDSDIARRIVNIRIVPRVEDPSTRTFKIPNLEGWAADNIEALTDALLTMVQSWVRAGMKRDHSQRLGSYEEWSGVMGGILAHAGIEGFLTNRTNFATVANTDQLAWKAFVSAWWEEFGADTKDTRELFQLASDREIELPIYGKDDRARKQSFGTKLGHQKDRVFNEKLVTFEGTGKGGVKKWRLAPLGKVEEGGPVDLGGPSGHVLSKTENECMDPNTSTQVHRSTLPADRPRETPFDRATATDRAAD